MDFVEIKGQYTLGFHTPGLITKGMRESMNTLASFDEFASTCFSPRRVVELQKVEISKNAVALDALIVSEAIEELYECTSVAHLAKVIDACLFAKGWRLPTEDEHEALMGGALFPWGDEIPASDETLDSWFKKRSLDAFVMNQDPYQVELCHAVLKAGDGGEALCGGYPWPYQWMPFAGAYRVPAAMVDQAFEEFIECIQVRPVRLPEFN